MWRMWAVRANATPPREPSGLSRISNTRTPRNSGALASASIAPASTPSPVHSSTLHNLAAATPSLRTRRCAHCGGTRRKMRSGHNITRLSSASTTASGTPPCGPIATQSSAKRSAEGSSVETMSSRSPSVGEESSVMMLAPCKMTDQLLDALEMILRTRTKTSLLTPQHNCRRRIPCTSGSPVYMPGSPALQGLPGMRTPTSHAPPEVLHNKTPGHAHTRARSTSGSPAHTAGSPALQDSRTCTSRPHEPHPPLKSPHLLPQRAMCVRQLERTYPSTTPHACSLNKKPEQKTEGDVRSSTRTHIAFINTPCLLPEQKP